MSNSILIATPAPFMACYRADAVKQGRKWGVRLLATAPDGTGARCAFSGKDAPEEVRTYGPFPTRREAFAWASDQAMGLAVAPPSAPVEASPVMVPQPSQPQQARAKGRTPQPARGERRYVAVRDTETGETHRVLTSVARVGFAVVIFTPSNRHRAGALGGRLITHDDIRKAWVFNDEVEARRFLGGNRETGERVIRAELVADPALVEAVTAMVPQLASKRNRGTRGPLSRQARRRPLSRATTRAR